VTRRQLEQIELTITVEDTGIGMTPEQCSHLFQAFTKSDSSTTRRFGGTGLELTISRSLVALMGASLRVTSHAGIGSTFSYAPCWYPGQRRACACW
jgi:signal transduction histidine kinase